MDQILCQCMLITERQVLAAIRAGADSVDEVGERCEAGTGCGSCRGGIGLLIEEEHARRRAHGSVPSQLLAQLRLFSPDSEG